MPGVEDLFHRKLVGWSFGSRITRELTITAIGQAVGGEKLAGGLIFHSERGSQYAAYDYQDTLCVSILFRTLHAHVEAEKNTRNAAEDKG